MDLVWVNYSGHVVITIFNQDIKQTKTMFINTNARFLLAHKSKG
jgi:hypothetical protein